MKAILILAALCASASFAAPRVQLFDAGWRFSDDPKHEALAHGAATNLPTSFTAENVRMPFAAKAYAADGTSAWLHRDFAFSLKDGAPGDRLRLELGGANYRCRAWLNGKLLGTHDGSCGTFGWDVTELVDREHANHVALHLETCRKGGTFDGLTVEQFPNRACNAAYLQEIPRLVRVPAQAIADVWARTDPKTGVLRLTVAARNDGKAATLPLSVSVARNGDDFALAEARTSVALKPGAGSGELELRVPDHRLWSPAEPNLYRVTVRLGEDVRTLKVGFRDLHVDDGGYFVLNGKRIFLKCAHTLPAFPDGYFANTSDAMRRQLLYFKACGYNAIRYLFSTSYPEMIDLCDEIGLMVYEEHAYSWVQKTCDNCETYMREACRDTLLRDRNHASFTIFGFMNETELSDVKKGLVPAVDRILPEMRAIAPDVLFLFQSGRWDGQLGRASASNPGSDRWDAWMGDEGPDRDMGAHNFAEGVAVGDAHYYPGHPVGSLANRDGLEKRLKGRRAVFLSEGGAGSEVNMVASFLKFDMLGWSRTQSEYACVREHALSFRRFFDRWGLNRIWPTPEAFVKDSQLYQARQRGIFTAMVRRNPRVSGYSMTMAMDKDFRGEGLTDTDGSAKCGSTEYLQDACADLMWCLTAKDACVYADQGLDVEVALSDFGMLKPNVKYPVRLRITGREGIKWDWFTELVVKADKDGYTPTATRVFDGHVDTHDWHADDYVLSAVFLSGAYATCGTKPLYVVDRCEVPADPDVTFVESDTLTDAQVAAYFAAVSNGACVVFANAAALAATNGVLRVPFAREARVKKEWNWLYHWEGIVHEGPFTGGLKNRMINDTEYFGGVWSDRCVTGLPPPDVPGFSCVYLGIDGYETKAYFDGLQLGAYRVGKGFVVLSTLGRTENDPVSDRVWNNMRSAALRRAD